MQADELVAEAKCIHCPEEDTAQQELELQILNKKCDEMTPRVEWWKQEVIRVRRQMEMSRARHQEEEQRLDRLGECENPYLAYRLEQVRQTFQVNLLSFNLFYFILLQITLRIQATYVFPLLPLIAACSVELRKEDDMFLFSVFYFPSLPSLS